MRGHVHQLNIETTMDVYEDNLDYLLNFNKMNKELKKDILDVGDKQNRTTNVKGDMTYWHMHTRYDSFKRLLVVVVKDHLENYRDLGLVNSNKVPIYCPNMWGAVYNKGDWTKEHAHQGSRFSFTYYVEANENCAPIVFTHPGFMQIRPKTGTLLIWDSMFKHMVPKTQMEGQRIVIAGNLNFHTETDVPQEVINT